MISPTTLTLKKLREDWPLVQVVEVWNPHARVRQDLFNLLDVIAVGPAGTIGVQATSDTNVSHRLRKIADHPNIAHIREAGWQIEVWGWAKKAGRWTLTRRVDVS